MSIVSYNTFTPGMQGVKPRRVQIVATDNLATVTAAGYLNKQGQVLQGLNLQPTDIVDMLYSFNVSTNVGSYAQFLVSISATGVITLDIWENPGNVELPVVDGNFANFSGTTGLIADLGYAPSDASATVVAMVDANAAPTLIAHFVDNDGTIAGTAGGVVNLGDITAGNAAFAGKFISSSGVFVGGSFIFKHVSNGASFDATVSPSASLGQSSVYTIPDPGAATANFLISGLAAAGTQHITSGSLQVDAGGFLAGLAAGGTAGRLTLFPATAANGSLVLAATNAGADFDMTITNSTLGQDSTIAIVDPANANARLLIGATATPFTSGNFPVASGTGGLMVDSGLAAANIQNKTNIIAATTADIGGAGAGPISVVVAGLTAASVVVATIESSTNTVAVAKCTATATGFDITFTGDPGAACLVNYVAFIAAQ